jgi:hypothetical protein
MSRPKLFSQITGQVHDASGINNPHQYYWEETNGIWYPMVGSKKTDLYARKCNITGKGMNEGYCFGNGEEYAIDEESALKIARNRGYASLEEAFDDGDYYYTDWEVDTINEECYDEDGNVVSVPDGEIVKPMRPPLSIGEVRVLIDELITAIESNTEELWDANLKQSHPAIKLQYITEELTNLKNQL